MTYRIYVRRVEQPPAEEDLQKKRGCYVVTAFVALAIVGITKLFWPDLIPFRFFEFWKIEGSLVDAVVSLWPLFLWGAGVTTIVSFLTINHPIENYYAERQLLVGVLVSVWAGVVEEICFRWLIFYGAIVSIQVVNWLFFGWAGFGVAEWFYTTIIGPVADFFTLNYLHDVLFNGYGWFVGAAVISANGKFRDGHLPNGIFGWVNSWFMGMAFFYVMFNFGLPVAIVVHLLYDLFIFTVRYIDQVIERALGLI